MAAGVVGIAGTKAKVDQIGDSSKLADFARIQSEDALRR